MPNTVIAAPEEIVEVPEAVLVVPPTKEKNTKPPAPTPPAPPAPKAEIPYVTNQQTMKEMGGLIMEMPQVALLAKYMDSNKLEVKEEAFTAALQGDFSLLETSLNTLGKEESSLYLGVVKDLYNNLKAFEDARTLQAITDVQEAFGTEENMTEVLDFFGEHMDDEFIADVDAVLLRGGNLAKVVANGLAVIYDQNKGVGKQSDEFGDVGKNTKTIAKDSRSNKSTPKVSKEDAARTKLREQLQKGEINLNQYTSASAHLSKLYQQ